jgi:hypothetical protein
MVHAKKGEAIASPAYLLCIHKSVNLSPNPSPTRRGALHPAPLPSQGRGWGLGPGRFRRNESFVDTQEPAYLHQEFKLIQSILEFAAAKVIFELPMPDRVIAWRDRGNSNSYEFAGV